MNNVSINERKYLYFLINAELGNATLRRLRSVLGSYENIYNAQDDDLKSLLSQSAFERFSKEKSTRDIDSDFEKLQLKRISFILNEDDNFPSKLRQIPDSPVALLVNGSLPSPKIPSVAIIGARGCSSYGSLMAKQYSSFLANMGIQIISGMAAGIDGIAGNAALDAGAKSFAVLGCGPDVCYPIGNQHLFDRLKEHGGIISEYALGTSGVKWHFPVRNRIISGLSDALLVIEAKAKSGTLITVDCALEQGKDVYALPGRTCDTLSIGCNNLIKQGAGILCTPEEFVSEFMHVISSKPEYEEYMDSFAISQTSNKKIAFSSKEEKAIYELLDFTPQSLDEISVKINSRITISLPEIMHHLTNLCVMGVAGSISGTNYRKI